MGIQIEFNLDLALRRYNSLNRDIEECIPEHIERGRAYKFLKRGQRNYWLEGEIPLLETNGLQQLSRPLANIRILTATHFIKDNEVFTRGLYKVIEVFDPSNKKVYFEGMNRRK